MDVTVEKDFQKIVMVADVTTMTKQEQEYEIVRRFNKYSVLGNDAVAMLFIACLADPELENEAVKRLILAYLDGARQNWDEFQKDKREYKMTRF